MIKLLIADDEKMIREGISHIVDWRQHGIEVVGVAVNGEHARGLFESARPDIVITDIRMPKLNGLELTQQIRDIDGNVKVIILSGYNEFDYAQQALRLGAADYLLKPVMPDRLVEKVLEMKEQILLERRKVEEENLLRIQIEESLPLLKERFLQELLSGQIVDQETIKGKVSYLGLQLSLNHTCCAIVIDLEQMDIIKSPSEEESQLIYFQAGNMLTSKVKELGVVFSLQSGQFGIIIQNVYLYGHEDFMEMLRLTCKNIQAELERECGVGSTIGIGISSDFLYTIRESYHAAVEAIKYKTILGSGHIIVFEEMESRQYVTTVFTEEIERDLIFAVKHADFSRIKTGLKEYLQSATNRKELDYAIMMSMRLIYAVSINLMEMSYKSTDIIGTEYEVWGRLKRCASLPDIFNEMNTLLYQLAHYLLNKRDDRQHRWIEQTITYLQEHYNEPLSLKKLSEAVYLSPNYICSLFKEETGHNISDYLTQLRVEKAKELLSEKGMKVYEVAHHAGYVDSRYFNKVFKKYTGMNMSEYRDLH